MKSASELLEILESEAADFAGSTTAQTKVGIAVSSKMGDEYGHVVWQDEQDRQRKLEALMRNGGEALGLILVSDSVLVSGTITIASSLFDDHALDPKVSRAINRICRKWAYHFREQLARCGTAKIIGHTNLETGMYSACTFLQ